MTVYARALGVALAQKSYDTHESSERAALRELLSTLDLEGVLIQADALHTTRPFFSGAWSKADVLLTVKSNQKTLYRQIGSQFQGKRHIPFTATDQEEKHDRDTIWELLLTSIRTTPDALLRLIRQRWSIQNEWHWARDAQLGEDAHRYANRTGAPVFSFLRTVAMNLLRRGRYRSIRQGLRELAYDIKGMLALGGVPTVGATT